MQEQAALKPDGFVDRSAAKDPQVAARAIAALLLLAWAILWPFLPQDRMSEGAYGWLVCVHPLAITGLALWAFADHLFQRRWIAAFLITPALSFTLTVASGMVMMMSAFLAGGGRMPI